jgi:putative tryptophan/tyrosine transport system substrate-binding protein
VRARRSLMPGLLERRSLLFASLCPFFPTAVRAQPFSKVRRVAFFITGNATRSSRWVDEFKAGMAERGWREGHDLRLDVTYVDAGFNRAASIQSDVAAMPPDVVVVTSDILGKAAAVTSMPVPVVFIYGLDPVGNGLVKSLNNPGGNVTGLSAQDRELVPKRLGILKELLPSLHSVGVLYFQGDPMSKQVMESLRQVVQSLGMKAFAAPYTGPEDIGSTYLHMAEAGVQATVSVPHTSAFPLRLELAELAIKHRIASIFGVPEFADAAALMAYGVDLSSMVRRAAGLVDRILHGANPASMPVEQANAYEFVLNMRTAEAMGIVVPNSVLLQVTRLIE